MNFAFFLFSFSAVAVQTLLFRELWIVFQGNELTLGIMFSQWLLGVAGGIFLSSRIPVTSARGENARLGWILILFALCAAGAFAAVRSGAFLFPVTGGAGMSIRAMLWGSLVVLFPAGFWSGTLSRYRNTETNAGRRHLLCALGALAGGMATTFVFIPLAGLNIVPLLGMITAAHFLTAACLFSISSLRYASFAIGVIAVISTLYLPPLGRAFTGPLKGYHINEAVDSPSARIIFAEKNGEERVFYGGMPFISLPVQRTAATEIFAHIPLLLHGRPRDILLVGGGERYIRHMLTHRIETLDYLGIDPAFTSFTRRYRHGGLTNDDPRLRILQADAGTFLEKSRKRYDVIVIGLPSPVNLLLNRFYTDEFFGSLNNRLADGGIGVLSQPRSLVYIHPAMAELNDIIITTLRRSFRFVRVIPGKDRNIIVFSSQATVPLTIVRQRFIKRNVSAFFLSPELISRLDDPENFRWFRAEMRKIQKENRVNSALHPHGMLAALVYRQSQFAPRAALAYRFVTRRAWIFSLGAFLLIVLLVRKRTSYTTVSSGFSAMALFLLGLWGVQATNSSLFSVLGLLTACFSAGWGTGLWYAGTERSRKGNPVLFTELFFLLWAAYGWVATLGVPTVGWFYYIFFFGAGFVTGFQFSLLAGRPDDRAAAQEKISLLGITGGWAAAGIGGAVLFPALGIHDTFLFIVALKLIGLFRWVH